MSSMWDLVGTCRYVQGRRTEKKRIHNNANLDIEIVTQAQRTQFQDPDFLPAIYAPGWQATFITQ